MGFIQGYQDGSFHPDDNITRLQFAFMVVRAFGLPVDETNRYDASHLEALIQAGILTGYSDGTFRPDEDITRAEIVTVLSRLTDYVQATHIYFSDISSNWAAASINAFAAAGIVNGKTETEFAPHASASRAEACAILIRLIDKLV